MAFSTIVGVVRVLIETKSETRRKRSSGGGTIDSRFDSRATRLVPPAHMSDETQTRGIEQTLYFGYGSNIWIEQMNRRCPDNKYIGVGVLREW
jgi:hypothetical protein